MKHCVSVIEGSLKIQEKEKEGLRVVGAMYDIETGQVILL